MRAALLSCLLLIVPMSGASAQFGFGLYRSGVNVAGEDLATVGRSVATVMASGTVGAVDSWSNPETGLFGDTTLLELYEDFDTQCARVRIVARRGDREAPFEFNFCERPDGTLAIAG